MRLSRLHSDPSQRGMRQVISRSLIPTGDSGMFWSSLLLMAKPTPCRRRVSSGRPFQKKVYPCPTSISESSPASRVSLKAAMSMLYLLSSLATRAVRLRGLSFPFCTSKSVRTLHVAKINSLNLYFRPRNGMPWRQRWATQEYREQAMFGSPFLDPPPGRG